MKKGFTLIELIVVIAIIGILILLGSGLYKGYTKEAELTKHMTYVKELESASERYYMKEGKWPKSSEEPYTAEELNTYAENIKGLTGDEVVLEAGNYYDIDYTALGKYVSVPEDKSNYILQNPVGSVYYLENLTEIGMDRAIKQEKVVMGEVTWNPADTHSGIALTANNLYTHQPSRLHLLARATVGKSSGKWYWETTVLRQPYNLSAIGIGVSDGSEIGQLGGTGNSYSSPKSIRYYQSSSTRLIYGGEFRSDITSPISVNDVISVILDMDSKIIEFRRNGIKVYSGSISDLITTTAYPIIDLFEMTALTNFGNTDFKYELPEGYLPYAAKQK